MTRFGTGFTRAFDAEAAAAELAGQIDARLGGAGRAIAGGLLWATAAAGDLAERVGKCLEAHWPDAELLGTSFEGLVADGRIVRDEPALILLAWTEGALEPVPFVVSPEARDAEERTADILDACGRERFGPGDLVLLFPDAFAPVGLEPLLAELGPRLAPAVLAGSAASGIDGHAARAFFGDESHPGALLGLYVPAEASAASSRVRAAAGSRLASRALEISACRPRWVDALEEEPALDWVRRQLGLDATASIEPHLPRLLARIESRRTGGAGDRSAIFDERYVVGVDERRGAFAMGGPFARGDRLSFALPDPAAAREALRTSLGELASTPLLLQFVCRARDAELHGDPDLESAWVAHHAGDRVVVGTVSPFQLASGEDGLARLLVHAAVLVALGDEKDS